MLNKLPFVIRQQCRRCGKGRDPREFVGGATVGYCFQCYEAHRTALEVLMGDIPKGCTDCGVSVHALSESQPGADIRMSVVAKDMLYAVLCPLCADRYELANQQLFKGTAYGAAKGII